MGIKGFTGHLCPILLIKKTIIMTEFLSAHWLDIFTTLLGLLYIWLEYRAHIALWLVSIIMPALDIWLYWQHGLYGDAGMAAYYTVAGIYGYVMWKYGAFLKGIMRGTRAAQTGSQDSSGTVVPITHMPLKKYLPVTLAFLAAWYATYWVLVSFTNSTVPVLDSFTNAMSFVGLWALAKKYIEQWVFWIVVDAVCFYLYINKGIPFKALLYGLYTIIAVAGYFKWKRMSEEAKQGSQLSAVK